MEKIESYEVNKKENQQKILIATQGSDYKNALVKGIIDTLKTVHIYIKVIDVSILKNEYVDNYDAIVIMHTWEMTKPQTDAAQFLKDYYNPNKIFVISTSGSGEEKIEGIDAITGASRIEEVPKHLKKILKWLDNNILLEPKR
jgi:hypothetical protein